MSSFHPLVAQWFAETLGEMVRFRNILVHAYAHVDVEKVHTALRTGLEDLRTFAFAIEQFVERQP